MRSKSVFALDNALRYMVDSLLVHEGRLMAIEFAHRGKRWRADTVEEAVELRHKLELDDYEAAKRDPKYHALLETKAAYVANVVESTLSFVRTLPSFDSSTAD